MASSNKKQKFDYSEYVFELQTKECYRMIGNLILENAGCYWKIEKDVDLLLKFVRGEIKEIPEGFPAKFYDYIREQRLFIKRAIKELKENKKLKKENRVSLIMVSEDLFKAMVKNEFPKFKCETKKDDLNGYLMEI